MLLVRYLKDLAYRPNDSEAQHHQTLQLWAHDVLFKKDKAWRLRIIQDYTIRHKLHEPIWLKVEVKMCELLTSYIGTGTSHETMREKFLQRIRKAWPIHQAYLRSLHRP